VRELRPALALLAQVLLRQPGGLRAAARGVPAPVRAGPALRGAGGPRS
jgi:hypothetical protein